MESLLVPADAAATGTKTDTAAPADGVATGTKIDTVPADGAATNTETDTAPADGASVTFYDGRQIWRLNGQIHRDNDMPAIVEANGARWWYQNGRIDRKNGLPAAISEDGTQTWFENGLMQRGGDMPAVIKADGTMMWCRAGCPHRDHNLPAIVMPNGSKRWYTWGKYLGDSHPTKNTCDCAACNALIIDGCHCAVCERARVARVQASVGAVYDESVIVPAAAIAPVPVAEAAVPIEAAPVPVAEAVVPIEAAPVPVAEAAVPTEAAPVPVAEAAVPTEAAPVPVAEAADKISFIMATCNVNATLAHSSLHKEGNLLCAIVALDNLAKETTASAEDYERAKPVMALIASALHMLKQEGDLAIATLYFTRLFAYSSDAVLTLILRQEPLYTPGLLTLAAKSTPRPGSVIAVMEHVYGRAALQEACNEVVLSNETPLECILNRLVSVETNDALAQECRMGMVRLLHLGADIASTTVAAWMPKLSREHAGWLMCLLIH